MTTSPTTSLFDPKSTDKISAGTFAYISARNRQNLYNLIIKEFKKSGLTQADLARRLGKTTDLVSRWFSRPRNMEVDTASEILFAISGAGLTFQPQYASAAKSKIASKSYDFAQTVSAETPTKSSDDISIRLVSRDTRVAA